MASTLKVSEIFLSIQGEGTRAGLPCTMVRLAGCNLRCSWCDTKYAWQEEGTEMSVDDVLDKVARLGCNRVEVTGGEPLLQPACLVLLKRLCDQGCRTLLETNGSISLRDVDGRVIKIVDFKCPSSGQSSANLWQNVECLAADDEVKFVIADRRDYVFAEAAVTGHKLLQRCAVLFCPVAGRLEPARLARWILADGLDVRLGLQLHKIIWPDKDRGV